MLVFFVGLLSVAMGVVWLTAAYAEGPVAIGDAGAFLLGMSGFLVGVIANIRLDDMKKSLRK